MGFNARGTDGSKYGIHGTNQPSSIGKYISQGCIRMKKNDVEYLFDRIPIGTKVWIVKSKSHFSNWQKKKEPLHMKSQRKSWLFYCNKLS